VKVGDLVRCAPDVYGDENAVGIITCIGSEGYTEEVEVLWTSGFADRSTHFTWQLEVLSESR
jgi:hypothetical protein